MHWTWCVVLLALRSMVIHCSICTKRHTDLEQIIHCQAVGVCSTNIERIISWTWGHT